MQAEQAAEALPDFYVNAKEVLSAQRFDQDLEDEIDALIREQEEEEAEIEALIADDIGEEADRRQVEITPSEFTEFAIRIPTGGELERFSFAQRRYLKPIYDTPARRLLLKCGRQTEKSTFLGNKAISMCGINYGFRVLYVSSTATQAQVFSVDRIKEPLDVSPEMSYLIDSTLNQNVFFKQFRNRSQIRIRYAFLNADRTRGIPADLIDIDEIQDINFANVPVIEQCASHSLWKLYCYSGTPKSLDNTIEKYWSEYSTQNEWMVPCERHGTPKKPWTWFWNILGIKNVGKKGLVCAKCGESIDPMHPLAQWAAKNPVSEENAHLVTFEGFRIPQLMVPWLNWQDDILMAIERYDTAQVYNEIFGLSYDTGVRPLSRMQVKACCQDDIRFSDVIANAHKCHGGCYVGLDWGCHDDQTRVLTDSGFKYFKDLTDKDLVAQFDKDTREMTFVLPEVRTVREWEEPLYHVSGKGVDMMLTGTHRVLSSGSSHTKWSVESMEDFSKHGGDRKVRGWVDWKGTELKTFTLPGLPTSPGYPGCNPIEIPGDLWVEFIGYMLSEGGLCYGKSKDGKRKLPSCVKTSQRVVDEDNTDRVVSIAVCLDKIEALGIKVSEFVNGATGDFNWTIYGKQLWQWWIDNIGSCGSDKRIPRELINLPKRQLRILFDAMMLGDGSEDKREQNDNGSYSSTSIKLCEDFQEVCIRLGLKSTTRLHKPAEGNRKARYRTSWSRRRDITLNRKAMGRIERVPYSGKVYCCKVPTGFIVTERNGCIAYQGNTGESSSYTVLTLGGYLGGEFQIFYVHRFMGMDLDPQRQLQMIAKLLVSIPFKLIGADYGGGHHSNDFLQRNFGTLKLAKYQYAGSPKYKLKWQPALGRFIVHRTEVMSDIFNAIKYKKIWFPNWSDFYIPFAEDCLNIFSEFNKQLNMTQFKLSPGKSDDSFHSILYCFLASMLNKPRPDIIIPLREGHVDFARAA